MRWFPLVVPLLLAAPAAAWTLSPTPTPLLVPEGGIEGSLDVVASLPDAAACALGDVNVDGHADLLLRTVDAAGNARLNAVAGPAFVEAIWSQAISAKAVLRCAPDLGVDGVADPVLRIAGETVSQAQGAASEARAVLQVIDGATGAVALARSVTDSATGAAASGTAAVQQVVHGTLLPAAQGAVAQVTTEATGAAALLPGALPLSSLGVEAAAKASLTLIDGAGRVVGTVSIDTPGVDPLALAPVPGAGLPQVAALTARAVSQVEGAAAQVSTLSLYSPDGTLQWAVDFAASTGVPSLLPRAGDLDLDGIPDLVVQTVQGTVDGVPSASLSVLSGLDGHLLFATSAVEGTVSALPLGAVGEGMALLQAAQATAGGAIDLKALDGAGQVIWSAQAEATAVAANLVRDPFSGDLSGFTDLTGDLVADVALAVPGNGSVAVKVLDGLTGQVAWVAELPSADQVLSLAMATGGQAVQTLSSAAGQASDLLGVASGVAGSLDLSLASGVDGQLRWTASASLPSGLGVVGVQSAGDIDADGRADLLVTVGPVSAEASADASSATAAATDAVRQVYAISSTTGNVVGAVSTAGLNVTAALDLVLTAGPAYLGTKAAVEETVPQAAPGAGILLGLAALASAGVVRRRK